MSALPPRNETLAGTKIEFRRAHAHGPRARTNLLNTPDCTIKHDVMRLRLFRRRRRSHRHVFAGAQLEHIRIILYIIIIWCLHINSAIHAYKRVRGSARARSELYTYIYICMNDNHNLLCFMPTSTSTICIFNRWLLARLWHLKEIPYGLCAFLIGSASSSGKGGLERRSATNDRELRTADRPSGAASRCALGGVDGRRSESGV